MIKENDARTSEEIKENKKTIARRVAKMAGKTTSCEVCGEHFLKNELKESDADGMVCPNCFVTMKCDCCDERFKEDELQAMVNINGETTYAHVCEDCKENLYTDDEPSATIFYNDDEEPCDICEYRDDTDGEFKVSWHSTDGWRGYYDVTPGEKWAKIHEDCILSYSQDAAQLKEFDEKFQECLQKMGIGYARAFSRTSNVFSSGYDFFVEKEKVLEAGALRVMLALRYRDPERFRKTALTGADPDSDDWTEHDELFCKAATLLEQGKTPEEAVEEVLSTAK